MRFLFICFGHNNIGDIMKVLIVGAASGIGYNLAGELSERGHIVYIGVHRKNQVAPTIKKILEDKKKINVCKLDVRNENDRKLIKKIEPDSLVIHAGIGNGGSILEMDIDVLRDNYETNVFSNFTLLKEFYQLKQNSNKPGKIFVTSSIAAHLPIPFLGCYTSSKAAISMLCNTLKYELKYLSKNITITLVEAGAYHTGFNQVMIDNKDLFTLKTGKIYNNIDMINRIMRNLFLLIEKKEDNDLVLKIIKELEKEKPRFKIRRPILQSVFLRIYLIFFA